jgi:hypothetical protein
MAGPGFAPSFDKCEQCGFTHPPVTGKCPMAKEKGPSGQELDLNPLFTPLRTIAISQIKTKDIKDLKKFFSYIIVEMTKLMEKYKE